MPASEQPQHESADDNAVDESSAETESVPMNRAERRAKAKGKATQQQHLSVGKINPHGAGAGHAHKQYSNRRSGGGK